MEEDEDEDEDEEREKTLHQNALTSAAAALQPSAAELAAKLTDRMARRAAGRLRLRARRGSWARGGCCPVGAGAPGATLPRRDPDSRSARRQGGTAKRRTGCPPEGGGAARGAASAHLDVRSRS